MKTKILFCLIFGIFLISFVSALDDLGTFQQDTCINLSQTCASCTYVNISSVSNNNNSTLISNVPMANFGNGEWRYEFCDTSDLGRYDIRGMGDINGVDSSFAYYLIITPSGIEIETADSFIYIIILIVTFLLFVGFLIPAIKLPYSNKVNNDGSVTQITKAKYLKLLCMWFSYGFFMWFLQTLNGISTSFVELKYLSNFITNLFIQSYRLSLGVTFLILSILVIETWKDIILNKQIKRYGKVFIDGRLQ